MAMCPRCKTPVKWVPPGILQCLCSDAAQRAQARAKVKPAPKGVADPYALPSFGELGRRAAEASRAAEPQPGTLARLQELQGTQPTPAAAVEAPAVEASATAAEPVAVEAGTGKRRKA